MIRAIWFPLSLSVLSFFLMVGVHPLFAFPFVILVLDARARAEDYKYLMKRFQHCSRTARFRLWDIYSHSRCGREVMSSADPAVRTYYWMLGYRWYHVFPDGTFSKKSPFINPRFWMTIWKPHVRQ